MYNKLFARILDSSIWLEPTSTRIVWITLLAAMDQDGFARFAALENLASRARVNTEQARKAVEALEAPDPNSSNPDHEGRRIERVPGGWMVLNAETHRAIFKRDVELEQNRIRVARHRAKKASNGGPLQGNDSHAYASDSALKGEGESEREKEKAKKAKRARPESEADVLAFCQLSGIPVSDGEYYWDHWQGNGFKNSGKAMADWQATIRSHKKAGYLPSQKQQGRAGKPTEQSELDRRLARDPNSPWFEGEKR
jgi:hypothetical protein